jgi:hypothetical protein
MIDLDETLVVFALFTAASLQAQSYSLGPDFATAGRRAEGDGDEACAGGGVFYPGTPHNYAGWQG